LQRRWGNAMPKLRTYFIFAGGEVEDEYKIRRGFPVSYKLDDSDISLLDVIIKSWISEGGEIVLVNPVEAKYPFRMMKRHVQILKNSSGVRTGYTLTERSPSNLAPTNDDPSRLWVLDSLFSHLPKKSDVSSTGTLKGGNFGVGDSMGGASQQKTT